jgi:hypothetical protein
MIVVNNNSGIGNRLKNIVTALRRAERKGDGLLINFPHQDFFTVDYQPNPETIRREIEVCTTWSLELFEDDLLRGVLKKPNSLKVYHDFETVFIMDNSIDFQFNNVQDWLFNEIKSCFGLIKFSKLVNDTVQSYMLKLDLADVVGVHIRTWSDDPGRHARLHDLSLFLRLMKDIPGERFFVATDSPSVLYELVKAFPNRIISSNHYQERHIAINSSQESLFIAIIDILLLSKCRRIIGTYSSTFTEVAWWLSSSDQAVTVPVPISCK